MARQLRDYQQEAVDCVRAEWQAGRSATTVILPTGTGKTLRDVPGYPGIRVASDGTVVGRSGAILRSESGRYHSVPWRKPDGAATTVGAHVLVCLAFHGQRPTPLHEVAHLNGDTRDNRAENVRWSTHVDNLADRDGHGTAQVGENNPRRKLTEGEVREIRAAAAGGESQRSIAARFHVTRPNVGYIVRRETWRHVQ